MSKLVDLLREAMREQREHVASLSADGSAHLSEEYVKGMVSGSDIMLSIVTEFFRKNSGTSGYLNLLDEDQLDFALRHTQSLIKRKEDESKVRIWTTENAHFWVMKKSVALQQLKDEIAAMDVESDYDEDNFKIHTALVRESELNNYLDPKDEGLIRSKGEDS